MKKRRKSKNIYDEYITMNNLYKMWNIIKKTCKNKKDVYYFSLNLNTNLTNIYKALKNKNYVPSRYRIFMIFEPKPRIVMSQTVTDKIVNHFVANYYLMPYLENSLIDANVATRKDKGGNYAMRLLKKYFNKFLVNKPNEEIYCLKIDVSKYFYSIDHQLLLKKLAKKIADNDVINLIRLIIDETNNEYVNNYIKRANEKYNLNIPYYLENTGLSIGAMSSQFLAIFYLSEIDHYIKEELKCNYYIRYMDDFLILDTDKEKLKKCYQCISKKIEESNLKVNRKSNIYRSSRGFSFLGYTYKVINNKLHVSCKKETYMRIQKKLSHLKENNITQYRKSKGSYYGYFEQATKIVRENLKVSARELSNSLKKEYKNYLIIVKEKQYYKIFDEDAKIMWHLFNYKYSNQMVMFGNNAFDKVINKLKTLDISFMIVSKSEELLSYRAEKSTYLTYYQVSQQSYDNAQKEKILINKLKVIFDKNPDCYNKINTFFDEIEKLNV